jgi:hypothetical protein
MPISSLGTLQMQKAHTLYRDHVIHFEQNADGFWRVTAVSHRYNGSPLLPPGFNYPDRATAERYAKLAIDGQLTAH